MFTLPVDEPIAPTLLFETDTGSVRAGEHIDPNFRPSQPSQLSSRAFGAILPLRTPCFFLCRPCSLIWEDGYLGSPSRDPV